MQLHYATVRDTDNGGNITRKIHRRTPHVIIFTNPRCRRNASLAPVQPLSRPQFLRGRRWPLPRRLRQTPLGCRTQRYPRYPHCRDSMLVRGDCRSRSLLRTSREVAHRSALTTEMGKPDGGGKVVGVTPRSGGETYFKKFKCG